MRWVKATRTDALDDHMDFPTEISFPLLDCDQSSVRPHTTFAAVGFVCFAVCSGAAAKSARIRVRPLSQCRQMVDGIW